MDNATNNTLQDANRYYLELGSVPESLTLFDIWTTITTHKKIIGLFNLIFLGLALVAWLMVPTNYKAEVVVAEAHPMLQSSSGSDDSIDLDVEVEVSEALAMIEARQFVTAFIQDNNLLPVLFKKDWNTEQGQWNNTDPKEHPTLWDGFDKFGDDVLDVETDDETKLTTIAITWTDPELAAAWANQLVSRVNQNLRQRTIEEAEKTLAYLNAEIAKTSAVEIRDSLYDLVKTEKAKVVAANVHEEYAFKIIDPAVVPEDPAIPYLGLILMGVGLILGTFCGVTLVLLLRLLELSKDH